VTSAVDVAASAERPAVTTDAHVDTPTDEYRRVTDDEDKLVEGMTEEERNVADNLQKRQ